VIIDGHNDVVLAAWQGDDPEHIVFEHASNVGFAGGFFALYVPHGRFEEPDGVPYALPLSEPVPVHEAMRIADELYATLLTLPVRLAQSVDDFAADHVTAIVHLEGAEPIAADLSNLELWVERGLRSLGLVWSRPNAFANGVPFRFPSTGDTGPGLTAAGRSLVAACNRLKVLVDLSHLNEAGFWEVARLSDAPLVATHSNAHALCASSRNLTDEQLEAIGASGGVVGVNFGVNFLRADGRRVTDTPRSEIVRQVLYLAERMGIDHVALGSDFDGATISTEVGGIEGLPGLVDELRMAGLDDDAVAKVTHGNWLRVLADTWQ
jgi:membrane dipeptidase